MESIKDKVYLFRISIVDENLSLYGYKLRVYSDKNFDSVYTGDKSGFSKDTLRFLSDYGVESFVGNKFAFVPVNEDLIKNEIIEILPSKRIYYELLNVEPSFDVLDHLEVLKKKGYRFTIDEYLLNDSFLNCVDIVEIDPGLYEEEEKLKNVVLFLKEKNKIPLAVNINTKEDFERYKGFGFELFAGNFLLEKEIIERRDSISPSKIAIIKLYNQLLSDVDINKIEEIFKKNPDLSYKLLKLINSAYFGLKKEISSLRHAIVLLGLKNLRKWVLYLMYAEEFSDVTSNPYFVQSVLRAKMMEKLCEKVCNDEEKREKAYLVGLLSNLDIVLQIPLEDIFDHLSVDQEIKDAILHNKGIIGDLLKLVKAVERESFDDVISISKYLGISLTDVLLVETVSIVELEKSKY